ncbi:MAG: flavin reductase family protein [Promethearchaeota archaeon]|nr:MAG: flavin reductase family protein [Candidatus Lokiarchaeota archaeon]
MKKVELSPKISTFPMPTAVISVGIGEEANLITLAYVGKVCFNPPIIAVSIQPKRHSYQLIDKHGEFVINYPTIEQLKETDYCGTRSGRDINKWKDLNLTKEQATIVKVPMIKEFPWNMECKVIKKIELGSHVCFFGRVVATHSDPNYVKNEVLDPEKFNFPAYIAGNYLELKKGILEKHGFSEEITN